MKHATKSPHSEHGAKVVNANCITKYSNHKNEDNSNNNKQATEIDPDDTSTIKEFSETYTDVIKNDSNGISQRPERQMTEFELDDQQERIAHADEEKNYYSIGIDNHNEWDDNRE